MKEKLESVLIMCVMIGSIALATMPAHVEGSTAPSEPLLPCFLAGTQITMADGSHKNIKQVEVGDMVKSFNNGSIVTGEVTKVYSHSPDEMGEYYLVINDKLKVTPSHIIYVNGGWVPARNITEGDELLNSQNETVIVTSVERVWEQAPTYNLEVSEYHTFFADNILVHNAKAPSEPYEPDPGSDPGDPSGLPDPTFDWNPSIPHGGQFVTFYATGRCASYPVVEWDWDIDGQGGGYGKSCEYQIYPYDYEVHHSVKLTIWDSDGNSKSTTKTLLADPSADLSVEEFKLNDDDGVVHYGEYVSFHIKVKNLGGRTNVEWSYKLTFENKDYIFWRGPLDKYATDEFDTQSFRVSETGIRQYTANLMVKAGSFPEEENIYDKDPSNNGAYINYFLTLE